MIDCSSDFAQKIVEHFKMEPRQPQLNSWKQIARTIEEFSDPVRGLPPIKIAMVGKYTGMSDSYLSICHSLQHAGIFLKRKVEIEWVDSSHLEEVSPEDSSADPKESNSSVEESDDDDDNDQEDEFDKRIRNQLADSIGVTANDTKILRAKALLALQTADGILVPGGFGVRGIEGKIEAVKWARENNVPFFGICLGLQVAVIEAARNLLMIPQATSTEFDEHTAEPFVMFMPEGSRSHMGGTMRLGKRKTLIHDQSSHTARLVRLVSSPPLPADEPVVSVEERHRHRYEVNPEYVPRLESVGLRFIGQDAEKQRMEIVERSDHPFFIATQFHPEFKSRPLKPSPYFVGLVEAAIQRQASKSSSSSSSSSSS